MRHPCPSFVRVQGNEGKYEYPVFLGHVIAFPLYTEYLVVSRDLCVHSLPLSSSASDDRRYHSQLFSVKKWHRSPFWLNFRVVSRMLGLLMIITMNDAQDGR